MQLQLGRCRVRGACTVVGLAALGMACKVRMQVCRREQGDGRVPLAAASECGQMAARTKLPTGASECRCPACTECTCLLLQHWTVPCVRSCLQQPCRPWEPGAGLLRGIRQRAAQRSMQQDAGETEHATRSKGNGACSNEQGRWSMQQGAGSRAQQGAESSMQKET